jgi:hypothetical protein
MKLSIEKYGIKLRLVELEDAEFILSLRNNPTLNKFLSPTSSDITLQIEWLQKYKIRESNNEEFYFVAEDESGIRYGTTRIYNIYDASFEAGSWIFLKDSPVDMAVKADIISREFGFEFLNAEYCRYEVLKKNKKVIRYQLGYHPTFVSEDEQKLYYRLSKDAFILHKNILLKLLNQDIEE